MAPIDRRVRLWAWMVRRQVSVASLTDEQLIAMQARHMPENAIFNRIFGSARPGTVVTDRSIPGPGGNLMVRTYRPAQECEHPRPLILNFHGGGFVFGDLRMSDWLCSSVALTVGAVVVSVQYRLAPGHRFPAAVDDCFAALRWAAQNAGSLGAAGPIGVMGESAGGNLAAVMCLLARDQGGPAIGHQALLYPATDMTTPVPLDEAGRKTPVLSPEEMIAFRRHYLGAADPRDIRASPMLGDHTGLPPALIQVGEHDPLREDCLRYAVRLRAAGVPVRFTEYVGMPHGFLNFPGLCRSANQGLSELCADQAAALAETASTSGGLSRREQIVDGDNRDWLALSRKEHLR